MRPFSRKADCAGGRVNCCTSELVTIFSPLSRLYFLFSWLPRLGWNLHTSKGTQVLPIWIPRRPSSVVILYSATFWAVVWWTSSTAFTLPYHVTMGRIKFSSVRYECRVNEHFFLNSFIALGPASSLDVIVPLKIARKRHDRPVVVFDSTSGGNAISS